jgi:glutathione reductase (NADPH)
MSKVYDYLVLGAGSGGIASARRAASYGKKVLVVEKARLGGTCVNVGCVPKKVMYNAASIREMIKDSKAYGFDVQYNGLSWGTLKEKRDAYIKRLNGIYLNNLSKDGIEIVNGTASFVDNNTIKVGENTYQGKHILIAVGSKAWIPSIPGGDLGMTSDGFFELEYLPKKVAIAGAGYIAIELAGIFNALGSQVSLFIRQSEFLRSFDSVIRQGIMQEYKDHGMEIVTNSAIQEVKIVDGKKTLVVKDKVSDQVKDYAGYEELIWAVGRDANTEPLNLKATGVEFKSDGFIKVDEYQQTAAPGVFALGDVCGVEMLTPVAIAAGRRLSDRLFGGKDGSKLDYENIPSVIFSHPTAGSIGLPEHVAVEKYGAENLKIYQSKVSLIYSVCEHVLLHDRL